LRPEPRPEPAARAELTLEVEQGAAPIAERILCRWRGRYGLTLGMLDGDWLFASALDGAFRLGRSTIRCIVGDPQGEAWRDVLIRRVLPRAAILAGASAFHAAAVGTDAGALLLIGPSGAGKSTLCAALAMRGWDILSEDLSLVWDPAAPQIAPASTGFCLWPDSRRALGLAEACCTAMPGYDDKLRCAAGHDTATALVPLRALVFLSRTGDATVPALHVLGSAEAAIRAAQQRDHFNPAEASGEAALDRFDRVAAIVRAVPRYRLRYPPTYAALDQTERLLRQLVPP
jgi:hypothetical protein